MGFERKIKFMVREDKLDKIVNQIMNNYNYQELWESVKRVMTKRTDKAFGSVTLKTLERFAPLIFKGMTK